LVGIFVKLSKTGLRFASDSKTTRVRLVSGFRVYGSGSVRVLK